MKRFFAFSLALVALAVAIAPSLAQRGPSTSRGPQCDARFAEDHDVIHFLLDHHREIERSVTELPNGVTTLTESRNPQVASKIKAHAKWMQVRIEQRQPIRRRDPLFDELFRHAEKISMTREETTGGVKVIETSNDPHVVQLIKAHARTVSLFIKNGHHEARKNHFVSTNTERTPIESVFPVIKEYGKVVRFPQASHQPRAGSRILVDLTAGGEPDQLNGSIEKLARFVNIYAGAGKESREVEITVVLHGDATLAILNDDAYGKRFQTERNPNLDCLKVLRKAGVKFYVCGQSLVGQGGHPDDVVDLAEVAVSGLTAIVNLQEDGFQYLPMLK